MNNLPIDFITVCLIFSLVMQAFSVWLTKLNEADSHILDRSTWIAHDGTMFEEYEVDGIEGSQIVFHHEAEQSRMPIAFLSQGLTLHPKA